MVNLLFNVVEQLEVRATVLKSTTDNTEVPLLEEEWLDIYIAHEFILHFHMTHDTFKALLTEINKNSDTTEVKAGTIIISIDKCLLISIWYFSKNETLMAIGNRFNVDPMTVYDAVTEILDRLKMLLPELIRWPKQDDCVNIADEFYAQGGYPNVIGAINICHIHYRIPTKFYRNTKINRALTLQGICTASKLFTSVSVGWPGVTHKGKVLKESKFGRNMENQGYCCYFSDNKYHLIGDSAYPLELWLMTPYKDTSQLTAVQETHNEVLEQTRLVIIDTFKLLKTRWQILQNVNTSIERAANIIVGCCVLHNFCILNEDFRELEQNFQ